MIEHGETLEADLARFYPRDKDQLTEWYAGRMSLRRLWVLVSNLPPDGATNEALSGGREVAAWTMQVELLAQAVDRLAILDHHYMSANSRSKIPEPEITKRPKVIADGARTQLRHSGR